MSMTTVLIENIYLYIEISTFYYELLEILFEVFMGNNCSKIHKMVFFKCDMVFVRVCCLRSFSKHCELCCYIFHFPL